MMKFINTPMLLRDPVLLHAFGTGWQLSKLCGATGLLLMLAGGLLAWILVRHTRAGQWKRVGSAEAADTASNAGRNPTERIGQVYAAKAVGGNVEISVGIDDLRQAARRGDWVKFWLWPISVSCWVGGFWFFFSAFTLWSSRMFWVLITLFLLLMFALAWFMAWAALYTKIDLGTAKADSAANARSPR